MLKLLLVVTSLWATSAVLWTGPTLSRATAQQDAVQQTEVARRLFNEGAALAEAERWAEALSAFRRSADLVLRPSTQYNIANALYRLDRPVEGLQELDRYQAMPQVLSNLQDRERGVDLRNLLERAVSRLRLTIKPASAEVFIDGKLCAATGPERDVLLDPGVHSIRVTQRGYETDARDIEVERGAQHAHAIELIPRSQVESPVGPLPAASRSIDLYPENSSRNPPTENDRRRFVKRPGFWVMIGSIAAVGIGAGVAAALVQRSDPLECGTTQSCATTRGLSAFSF